MNYCIFFNKEEIGIEIPVEAESHTSMVIKYCAKYLPHFGYLNAHGVFTLFPHIDYTSMERVVEWGYKVIPFSVIE